MAAQAAMAGKRENMKALSFTTPQRRPTWGIKKAKGVVDLGARLPGLPDLRAALAAGWTGDIVPAGIVADYRCDEITFLPVIPNPDKVLCVGINYGAHAAETGRGIAGAPSLFSRFADTLVGHGRPVQRPRISTHLDFEGELAVVIGRPGHHIPRETALSHVAGYCCFMDGSIRDYQKHSVTAGKNFPATGGLGPWLVTEGVDPGALTLTTRLNGEVVQEASTAAMIHDVAAIIAYASQITPLTPGTVIATGTPEGVGSRRVPPLWMKPGDVVEVSITGLGTLRNPIADAVQE